APHHLHPGRAHAASGASPKGHMTTVGRPETRQGIRREFMLFSPPSIGEEEIQEAVDTLRSPWITTGPKTRRFEQEFGAAVSAPGALALNSCTARLHTALACLG